MKKFVLPGLVILFSISAHAQQFFIKAGLGYAIPQAGQSVDGTGLPYNGSITGTNTGNSVYNYKNGASFSAGLSGTVGGGYMFSNHVGLELDMIAGLAPKQYTGGLNNRILDSSGVVYNISVKQYASTYFLVAPQLIVQTGGEIWNLYARGGVVLPLYTHIMSQEGFTNLPGNGAVETDLYTYDNSTSFSVGLTGAIGAQYNLTHDVSLWGEVNALSMSLYLKEQDFKSVTVNGQSAQLVPGSVTSIPYSNNFTSGGSQGTMPSYAVPFSNVGLHVGIMYKFDKQAHVNTHARPSHGSSKSKGRGSGRDNVF